MSSSSKRVSVAGLALVVALGGFAALRLQAADDKAEAVKAADKPADKAAASDRVFEMRTYHASPGKMDALHARFRDHTNKLLEKHGAKLIGHWTVVAKADDPKDGGTLVWILAYPSMEAREKTWKSFQADPDWQKAKADSEKGGVLVAKAEQVFMNPTDYSPLK